MRGTENEKRGHVLILDDDKALLSLLVDILDLRGYKVRTAGNGLEGLQHLDNGSFDVIISDIEMPVMDGRDFYRTLIERQPSMKGEVIFISTAKDDGIESFLKDSGCRHLEKPFKMDALLRLVEDVSLGEGSGVFQEKREEKREQMEVECLIVNEALETMPLAATTVDISPQSLGIRYSGEPLEVDDVYDIHLKELDETRRMSVVWSSSIVGKVNGAGFRMVGVVGHA